MRRLKNPFFFFLKKKSAFHLERMLRCIHTPISNTRQKQFRQMKANRLEPSTKPPGTPLMGTFTRQQREFSPFERVLVALSGGSDLVSKPPLISLMVSVDVKHYVYLFQEERGHVTYVYVVSLELSNSTETGPFFHAMGVKPCRAKTDKASFTFTRSFT